MISDFKVPLISPHMMEARVECLHAAVGESLKSGAKLFDLSVDLSNNFSQDCPPISFFRIILRENGVLRDLRFAVGDLCTVGSVLAVFSTTADEALDQPAPRGIRFATAGIIRHSGMWTGNVT
jgi:pyruvate/2-oxoglutarate dehydrogenase complex dihydrolipoamide acyltransferase (E2) component